MLSFYTPWKRQKTKVTIAQKWVKRHFILETSTKAPQWEFFHNINLRKSMDILLSNRFFNVATFLLLTHFPPIFHSRINQVVDFY